MNLKLSTLLLCCLSPALLNAHHAFRAIYDFSKIETVEGNVVELELVNPHARIHIDVTSENGEVERWVIEGPGKLALARRGWTDDMFTPGEMISVSGNPSFAGDNAIWIEKIVTADGREIIDPLVSDQLAIEEERRNRIRNANP